MNKYHSAMEKIKVSEKMKEKILKDAEKTTIEKQKSNNWHNYIVSVAACFIVVVAVTFIYRNYIGSDVKERKTQTNSVADNSEKSIPQSDKKSDEIKMVGSYQEDKKNRQQKETEKQQSEDKEKGNKNIKKQPSKENNNNKPRQDKKTTTRTEVASNSNKPSNKEDQSDLVSTPITNTKDIDELKKSISFQLMLPTKLPLNYKLKETSIIAGELAQIVYTNGDSKITYRTAQGTEDISGDYTDYSSTKTIEVSNTKVKFKEEKDLVRLAVWSNNGIAYSLSFSIGVEEKVVISIIKSIKEV